MFNYHEIRRLELEVEHLKKQRDEAIDAATKLREENEELALRERIARLYADNDPEVDRIIEAAKKPRIKYRQKFERELNRLNEPRVTVIDYEQSRRDFEIRRQNAWLQANQMTQHHQNALMAARQQGLASMCGSGFGVAPLGFLTYRP